ncbi:hypothetical protein QL285_050701 [Trifolium repens]|nr:hypothetical protein QL285_050700 [Trifolium repens]KAK2401075.1 hypothetical protein QL285_050701 [Trifolium repens]
MDALEQENAQLQEQVTTFRAELDRVNAMVEALMAAHNRPPTPQAAVVSEIVSAPIPVIHGSTPQHVMPEGYPWGMPINVMEGFHFPTSGFPTSFVQHANVIPQPGMTFPQVAVPVSPLTTTFPTSIVHTAPVHHEESTANAGARVRMDDILAQFDRMQLEIKALRGKDLFSKNAHDLCLVPNVKIPPKFKVPEFEKYKGNSCPQSHFVMYARKMSTQTDNHQLLIHYFQDSLAGAALKWYMGLDSANIRTFNDLGDAFIRQYKYNLDIAPDRDQLRAMTQKDKESFKEYAQRWREIAAQISPPLEEKEMTKIFLKTLESFYYERMIASAPSDFTEMVNMGMRLEEGVREGRLVKESGSSNIHTRNFEGGFPKKKEQEVGMVAQGRPRGGKYQHHVAAATPAVNNQNLTQRTSQFDTIPMTYAELFPMLIEKNLVQTRAPPKVPATLPRWYRSDHFCAFHQGAPGHDIERCFALKAEVQRLVKDNILSFKDQNPKA